MKDEGVKDEGVRGKSVNRPQGSGESRRDRTGIAQVSHRES